MVKIEYYNFSGFKNIDIANVSFSNFNVIIGPNNAGKSNFLQSISFLNHVINGATDEVDENFNKGTFFATSFGQPEKKPTVLNYDKNYNGKIDFELGFLNTENSSHYIYRLSIAFTRLKFEFATYKIDSESLEMKVEGRPGKASTIFNRQGNDIKFRSDIPKIGLASIPTHLSVIRLFKLLPVKNEYSDAIFSLNKVLKTPIFYFSHTELRKAETADQVFAYNGRTIAFDLEEEIVALSKTDKWEIFQSAVRNVLNIDEISVLKYKVGEEGKQREQYIIAIKQFEAPKRVKEMSDGSILVLALITKILNSEFDIYFIEEPENSTHPKALIDLIQFLQSFSESKQFVITSHSIPILNKTKIDDVITTVINVDGQSEFKNVKSQKELRARLKSSHVNFSDEIFFSNNEEEFN